MEQPLWSGAGCCDGGRALEGFTPPGNDTLHMDPTHQGNGECGQRAEGWKYKPHDLHGG